MKSFKFFSIVLAGFFIFGGWGCKSEIDNELDKITPYQKFIGKKLIVDSLPQGFDVTLFKFASNFPKYESSSDFLYAASLIAEYRGNASRIIDYCNLYLKNYPKDKSRRKELAMVGAQYSEQSSNFDAALKFYQLLKSEFPNDPVAKQAEMGIEMINKGILTPDAALEYLLEKNKHQDTNQ